MEERSAAQLLRCLGILAALSGCGPNHKYNAACNKIAVKVCNHEVECGIEQDLFACEGAFSSEYTCDPSATVADLQRCADAAEVLACTQSVPFLCFAVLCDPVSGCNPTQSTTPPAETGGTGTP